MATAAPADQSARDRIHQELDGTLFVEAGAGTGKTRELIERIFHLVAGGRAELQRIAAITFTEAAAAELRDRVRIRLEEASEDGSLADGERERCRVSLAEIDAAAIETLHGFAQRILSEHPLEAGLPPAVEIQDEIRASIAFDERWSAFVDELLEDPSLEEPLLRAFMLGLKIGDLRAVAWTFHQHWDRLEGLTLEQPPQPPINLELLQHALDAACDHGGRCTDPNDLLLLHLHTVGRYRQRLRDGVDDLDRLRILATPQRLKFSHGRKDSWHGVAKDDILAHLSQASDLRDEQLAAQRRAALAPIVAALRDFILRYAGERRRQGRLEFHDLLVQARDLLLRDPSVREHVRRRFTHLLIDEFQDTDPLQIEIAVLIAGGGGEPAPSWQDAEIERGRLFFVGDPKQSIYRFRRADIDLYHRAQERFVDEAVRLTQNFRSGAPIIEWANRVFGRLMPDGDHEEGQARYVPLEPWRSGAHVTVRTVGGPSDQESVHEVRRREAVELVRTIEAIKAERWQVEDGDATRDALYKDIALLLPTRTTLPPIERALEDAGIPYRVESRSLVYDTPEVRDLLAALRAIDDPTDEVAIVSALRSPAFACGDDDLLRYHRAGGRWDYRRDPPEELGKDDPVVAAMAHLERLHERRWWEPVSGIVEAVIRERRLFQLAFAHRRPRERWQRLRFFLDQARAFAEAGGRTLRQFIEWAERQADEGTRVVETVVPEADDDAVRIMTIHAAKGLEFPIVVMAGLNLQGRSSGQKDEPVLWDPDGRPEVSAGDFKTAGYEALKLREETMEAHEKVRLLYVAATRARDHLVVSLHHKLPKSDKGESHASRLFAVCDPDPPRQQMPMPLATAATNGAPATTEPFEDSAERRQAWLAERDERIRTLARVPVVAATEVASMDADGDDPNLRKDPPVEEVPPWRRGRAGTAFGRAVHAVLQSIDLATGADLESAAAAQAAAEGIAERRDDIVRSVRAALASDAVREAVAGGRMWREIYVAAPVGERTLEGFIDLLYETPDGLVVVDYKTDRVPGAEELTEALARYRLQGAAYALALEETLRRPVARCVFVFAQPSGAQERAIDDLPAAVAEVRERLARP